MQKSYRAGMADGLKLWGEVCQKEVSCSACPIGQMKGLNVSCQEFASKFPMKMISILEEIKNNGTTYYEEFCARFPEMDLIEEDLAELACRKAVFEGYLACDRAEIPDACLECWKQKYVGDVTETDSADSQQGVAYIKVDKS